ncbi:MAG: ATP-binding protein [Clostridiales bacterium]|jgi:predicted AAA+ superfamily ATPase|nr:ATP-binding protein [Clostridiales bacterium]
MDRKYMPRIVDSLLDLKLRSFGAVNIVGPKWCGKTTTAEQRAKSVLKLQKEQDKEALMVTADINPSILLEGEKPRLIDEWQDAPKIWDAVRIYCDENKGQGHFILTGSTSKKVIAAHTGTGRISRLKMYPMSLYESGESNGTVSLSSLFEGKNYLKEGCVSGLTIEKIIDCACRGGWPESVVINDLESQMEISRDYFQQIYEVDMFQVDKVKRNKSTMKAVIKSYARNISTFASKKSILKDVTATNQISEPTLDDYIGVLEQLFIIEDIYGWSPDIRSARSIRSGRKREFTDPSIAVAALGGSSRIFQKDLKTFGFIFENLCIRDLKIYSSKINGELSYYSDKYGLEADAVLHLNDNRYALIEIKLGGKGIEEGAAHLCELERLIVEKISNDKNCSLLPPTLKIVITGTKYGFRREDGVFVIPIGCLKD